MIEAFLSLGQLAILIALINGVFLFFAYLVKNHVLDQVEYDFSTSAIIITFQVGFNLLYWICALLAVLKLPFVL